MTVSAFYNPSDGTLVITGKNDSDHAQVLDGVLKNLSAFSSLSYYYTDAQHNFSKGPDTRISHQAFSKSIPANAVFYLGREIAASLRPQELRKRSHVLLHVYDGLHYDRGSGETLDDFYKIG